MKRYVGIDVEQDQCALCILNDAGGIVFDGTCATDPDEIVRAIAKEGGDGEKIAYDSGPLSVWLTQELIKRVAPIVCIDARAAYKVLSACTNKSDRIEYVHLDVETSHRDSGRMTSPSNINAPEIRGLRS